MCPSRKCARRARLTVLAAMLAAGTMLAASVQAAAPWTQTLSQQALDNGFLTRLPPNVSTAFGLTKPQEGTEVRQLLTKQGHQIKTFNVSVANHDDVVVLDLNGQSGASVAYLVSRDGELRKAVSYQGAGEVKPLGAADAKAGLAREKRYWSARAKSAPAAAPATPAAQTGSGH
jgi:hypothetical protein